MNSQNTINQQHNQSNHSLSQQSPKDLHNSKKKRSIFWIYLITIVMFVTVCFILISYAWQPAVQLYDSDHFYLANQISAQWKQVTKSEKCPQNYQHAINYQWPGYGYGCYCQQNQNLSFVLQGYCLPSLIEFNCTNLLNQEAITAHLWRNKSNICLRRSTVSFFNEKKYDGANKICGSANSLVIVPKIQPCPYVNISFTPFTLEDNVVNATDIDSILPILQSAYNSTSPQSFYAYPVGKLRVSEYQFCQIDEDYGISPGHSDFVLLNLEMGCLKAGNYTTLDTINQTDFYSNNSNLQALTAVQGFPIPGNWQYRLGYSSVPSWTYQCRHNYDSKFTISKSISQFNFQFNSAYSIIAIVQIVCCVVIAVEVFILALQRCMNNYIYPIGYKQKYLPQQFNLSLIRYIVDGISKLTLLSLGIAVTYLTYSNWSWFKGAINQDCTDGNIEMINDILVPYRSLYWNMFSYSLGLLCLTSLMLIIDVIHFWYIYKQELQYYLMQDGLKLVGEHSSREVDELKWLQLGHQKQSQLQDGNDEFKITMTHNIFAYELQSVEPTSSIVKKKKKNKRKKLFHQEVKQSSPYDGKVNDQFNPYIMDDDSFMPVDSSTKIKPKGKRKSKY